jgi:hypothetical protein
MKLPFLIALSVMMLMTGQLNSQQVTKLPVHHLQVAMGSSRHGSGDMNGIMFSTEYSRYIQRKVSWHASLSGTIHNGNTPLHFTDQQGNDVDGSIRYAASGMQLAGLMGYSIARSAWFDFQAKAGLLFRYQSSTVPDQYEIAYPGATGLPYPVIIYRHSSPQQTYSGGGIVQLSYNFTFKEKYSLGLLTGFQADIAGDNIFHAMLAAGIRL